MKNKRLIVIALILCISIGFAYLSANLSINGSFVFKKASFDVHFEDAVVGDNDIINPTISIDTDKTSLTIGGQFDLPGNKATYNFNVVNGGTIDAVVEDIAVTGLDSSMEDVFSYKVRFIDGGYTMKRHIIRAGETKAAEIVFTYNEDVDEFNTTPISISITPTFIQHNEKKSGIKYNEFTFIYYRSGINGGKYQFIEGMKFQEWVNSEFNDGSITLMHEPPNMMLWKDACFAADLGDGTIESKDYYLDHAECVSPESDILINLDGSTIKAKNIKENDTIVYYDFVDNTNKVGTVTKVYIHKEATSFVRYHFEDGTYLEVTDYHPIYTNTGWKSYTNRNNYPKPVVGDLVKTTTGYKSITQIEKYEGLEDFYDFEINNKEVNNYYANDYLVEGSY